MTKRPKLRTCINCKRLYSESEYSHPLGICSFVCVKELGVEKIQKAMEANVAMLSKAFQDRYFPKGTRKIVKT